MRNYFLLLFLALFINCKKQNETTVTASAVGPEPTSEVAANDAVDYAKFAGDWSAKKSGTGATAATFELHLEVNGISVKGYYCSVVQGGNKIDCSDDKTVNNISGTIKQDAAFISFTGLYDEKATGEAKLYFSGDSLVWELTKSTGQLYVPKREILTLSSGSDLDKPQGGLPISGKTLSKLPFTEIKEQIIGLDDYYCGMYPKFFECPMVGKYQVKIIDNECGDFPFYALVTTFRGKYVDKKVIYMEDWEDLENPENKSNTNFEIDKDYIVTVTENVSAKGKQSSKISKYKIDESTGLFKTVK